MTTQSQVQSQSGDAKDIKRIISGELVVGFAVLGCLAAGTIGIFKAISVAGVPAAACLLASVAAFGTVCYIYFRRD
jgi:hypothetical protein